MNKFIIVTDTSADLDEEFIKKNDLRVIPIMFIMEEKEYDPRGNNDADKKGYYDKIMQGVRISTAASGEGAFKPVFEEILKSGSDIFYTGLASGVSSSYSTGETVMNQMREKYPDRKMVSVNSCATSLGLKRILIEVLKLRDAGKSVEEAEKKVIEMRKTNKQLFTVESLKYLFRGGRLSRVSAVLGTVLQLKPILQLNDKINAVGKIMGRKSSIANLANRVVEGIKNPEEQIIYIAHADCLEDAKSLAKLIESKIKVKGFEYAYLNITIGAHTGPGGLAVFFDGKDENK